MDAPHPQGNTGHNIPHVVIAAILLFLHEAIGYSSLSGSWYETTVVPYVAINTSDVHRKYTS